MNIMAVDDERPALRILESAIREEVPDCTLTTFWIAEEALAYARETRQDIAFLDIDMTGINGLALAKALKEAYAKTNIVFVTGYADYAVEAFSISASGYILKPVAAESVARALQNLRYPMPAEWRARVEVMCFGSFGVLVDGRPLLFPRAKPKELLAYLVHKNGAAASPAELSAILWEDNGNRKSLQSQTRKTIAQLMQILREAGIEDIVQKGWNSIALDVDKISCDYHGFLAGDLRALNAYAGEYLTDYSWAEFVVARIDSAVMRDG